MKSADAIRLTAVIVEDPTTHEFNAFFAELPNIIAEGKNEQAAIENLFELINAVFERQKSELAVEEISGMESVTTRSFELSVAQ